MSSIDNAKLGLATINDTTLQSIMQDTAAKQSTQEGPPDAAFVFKFGAPKQYSHHEHVNVLALPKPEYQGRDFF